MAEVSDNTVESALRYLAETDRDHAVARAEVNALNDLTKTILGFAYESEEGPVEARKAAAYRSPEYIAHVEKKKTAEIEYFTMDNKRKRAALSIEVWRTIQANKRQGNV